MGRLRGRQGFADLDWNCSSMEVEDDEVDGSLMEEAPRDDVDDPRATTSSSATHRPILSGEQLDLDSYASLYSGRTKICRLIFIADHCVNPSTQLDALRIAYDELKKGVNLHLFRAVVQKIDGRLGPDYDMDSAWVDYVHRRAEQRKDKLENELNAYRTNLIKESIRMGYNDFGDFYYAHGMLADAFKNFVRTRDYCTTSKHVLHMCLNAILVSIEMGQFTHVTSYVGKAEQILDTIDPINVSKLRCAAGLAYLEARKYKLAARKFLETCPELGSNYSDVISSQDVATYGGLCALASFDRSELKNKVIDNLKFRNFLELLPELRELIHDFYSSHYASCLEYLGNMKATLLLDIHLHDHLGTLYDQIRHKALIQYTHPFLSMDLNMMANAFRTTVSGLEKELETLITDNQIQARIDSHNKILYARQTDQRNVTFQRVMQTGKELEKDVKALLVRASLIKHDFNTSSRKM